MVFFFFKQKTAYEMRISDWSSDVCSSDLVARQADQAGQLFVEPQAGMQGHGAALREAGQHDARGGDAACVLACDQRAHGSFGLADAGGVFRSEERRVGHGWGSTCQTRGSTYHEKK